MTSTTEAPRSVNFYGITKTGWNCQFTVRALDNEGLLEAMGDLVKRLEGFGVVPKAVGAQSFGYQPGAEEPQYVAPVPVQESTDPAWCAIHNVKMNKYEKEGRSWYSHKYGDSWCKGK